MTVLSSGLDGGGMRSPTDDLLNGSSIYFGLNCTWIKWLSTCSD